MSSDDFENYCKGLRQLGGAIASDPTHELEIREAVQALVDLPVISRQSVADLIRRQPACVPVLGLAVGLGQERLKRILQHRLGSASWIKVGRLRPHEVVDVLDTDYGLLAQLEAQRHEVFTYADVLVARASGRRTAGAGQARGRSVEDAIEAVLVRLGLPHALRTRFIGRGGQDAPCDAAVPSGAADARIVVAAKGFDSTGSKLGDAVTEITAMLEVRLPNQYVFAVVDGIGWLGRKSDLRKIYALWEKNHLNGLYHLGMLERFASDLEHAADVTGITREGRTAP